MPGLTRRCVWALAGCFLCQNGAVSRKTKLILAPTALVFRVLPLGISKPHVRSAHDSAGSLGTRSDARRPKEHNRFNPSCGSE